MAYSHLVSSICVASVWLGVACCWFSFVFWTFSSMNLVFVILTVASACHYLGLFLPVKVGQPRYLFHHISLPYFRFISHYLFSSLGFGMGWLGSWVDRCLTTPSSLSSFTVDTSDIVENSDGLVLLSTYITLLIRAVTSFLHETQAGKSLSYAS